MHKLLWTWHRRIGAFLAIVVVILSISGIALNHTEQFRLDQRHVQADWILDWYGIAVPEQAQVTPVNQIRITLLGDHLYAADKFIGAPYSDLLGAHWNGQVIAVVVGADLLLLTAQLELVEQVSVAGGLPPGTIVGCNDSARPSSRPSAPPGRPERHLQPGTWGPALDRHRNAPAPGTG